MARPGHGGPSSQTGGNNTGDGIAARADSPPPSLCRPLSVFPPAESAAQGLYCCRGGGQPGAPSLHSCRVAPWLSGKSPTQQPQTHSSSGVQSPLVLICSNQGSQCNYPGWLIRAPTGLVWRTEPLSRGLGHRRRWGWGLEQEGMGMHEAADSFRHLGTAEIRLWPFSHCLYTFFRSPRCLRSDLARKKT